MSAMLFDLSVTRNEIFMLKLYYIKVKDEKVKVKLFIVSYFPRCWKNVHKKIEVAVSHSLHKKFVYNLRNVGDKRDACKF